MDQWAKHQHGYWYKQGMRVKSALIQAISGKNVQVRVEGYDKYDRVIGTVLFNGKDVGEWLVRNGHAIAAYGDQYKHLEREARRVRRGVWGLPRLTIHGLGGTDRPHFGSPRLEFSHPQRATARRYEAEQAMDAEPQAVSSTTRPTGPPPNPD